MKLEFIFAVFAVLAVIDKVFGNKFKLGDEFDRGISTAGPLILSMSGMIVLAPILADGISFIFRPVLEFLHIDLSMIATFFPSDAGGASMAYELSEDVKMRGYNGIVVASMFGATLCPVIPLSLQMVDKKYHDDILVGLLCGIATIPLGCLVAGLIIGIELLPLLLNTAPIIALSALICFGLVKAPDFVRKLLGIVGKVLLALVAVGLGIGIIKTLCGFDVIKNTAPLEDSFKIIGNIVIILAGVFPLLSIISRLFNKAFEKLGKLLKIDNGAVLGLVTSLANSIPVFSMMGEYTSRGRIMNMAFAVSAAYVFGDHLAFALSFDSSFALPMIVGKLIGGFSALIIAHFVSKKKLEGHVSLPK